MRRATPLVLALSIVATSFTGMPAFAAGFQLQEQTASGLGVAYAGMPAAAQDAGTAFWNPAALPLLDGVQAAAAVHYIDTSFDFSSQGPPPGGSTYHALGDGGDAGSGTTVPALYLTWRIQERLGIGLVIDAPFGLKTDWSVPWAGEFAGLRSEVKTLNVNPVVGYRINPHWLIGGGVSYQRLKATLSNGVTPLIPTAIGTLDGDDWAFGWNAGVLFESGNGTHAGLTYRSTTDYKISGDLTFNNPALTALQSNVSARLKLPQIVSVGVSQKLGERTRLLVDASWTRWNTIQTLTIVATDGPRAGQVVANTPLNFENSWRAGLGGEYAITPQWLLRLGLAYDRSPVQDAFRTPRLPDEDRKWAAIGARFQPSDSWSIDAGYAHLWVRSASSDLSPVGAVPGFLRGSYDSSSDIVAAQASVRF
ncbi:MAG TPA: outer membrane protein transport protein [Steroidobacteraceae bacterium]|nr:outer membrane protein transport protein [Steroidobacteraceae bacterium]